MAGHPLCSPVKQYTLEEGVTLTMKRLVAMLLVLCMVIPTMALGEDIVLMDDGIVFEDTAPIVPEDEPQEPVEEEEPELVLPEDETLVVKPNTGVNGPDPYRELVLLQPTDLYGTAIDVNTIRLSWSPVAFATKYEVRRKLLGETEYTTIATTLDNQLYYEDTGVTPGQVAYYRVRAVNISYDGDTAVPTESPESATLPFITLAAPVMNDPRGTGDDTVRLSWGSVAGSTTYEVETATSKNGPFTLSRKGLKTAYCDASGLQNSKGYYFRVRAVRTFSSGEVFYSEYSNVTCGTPMAVPSLSVAADGDDIVLSWSKCPGATNYIIYHKAPGSSVYTKLAEVGNVTGYTLADCTPGEVHYFFVYAKRPVGDYNCFSNSSAHMPCTVLDPVVINAIQNDPAVRGQQQIDWTGPEGGECRGASHYLVYISTTIDGLYTEIAEVAAPSTTYVATGLELNQTYFYKVRAIRKYSSGGVSYGPWSNIMSMPEAGVLQLNGLSGRNDTYYAEFGKDITGGYTGDVFTWSVKASGGSGAYSFRWSLVPIEGGTGIILKDYSDGYVALEEGKTELVDSCSLTLNDAHIKLITEQQYGIQVEVRDSEGAVAGIYACGDTFAELTFVAARPTTQFVNVTLRAGEKMTMEHGVRPEAGDVVLWDISNPTGAVSVNTETYEVTALANGYATVLITPQRWKNDVLIAYNFTVGYATLTINSITPSATTMNNYGTLSWDINYTGGRPDYKLEYKVYRDSTLVAQSSKTTAEEGLLSVNYQPTEPGSYYLEVSISTADSQTATLRSPVTKVVRYTPVTVIPSVTTASTGTTITWACNYTGNSEAVRRDYTLFRDGVVVSSSVGTNDVAFRHTPTKAGSYILQVVVYEKNGNRIEVTSTTVTVTEGSDLSGSGSGTGNAKVIGTRLAMRKGPGTNYGIIKRVNTGEYVTVIKTQGSWSYVDYKGAKGWMMSSYLKMLN